MATARFGLAAMVLAFLAGCGSHQNQTPVIRSVQGDTIISATDSAWFLCDATDPDGDLLTYSWSASGGRVSWDWGRSTWLLAPDSSDTVVLRVTVTDDSGLSAYDSVKVKVLADTIGLLFWDGTVKAGTYREWTDTVRARFTLYGRVTGDTGEFYFMVVDDTGFNRWRAQQPVTPLVRFLPYLTDTFSVRIPATGRYHMILDNLDGPEDYDYTVSIYARSR